MNIKKIFGLGAVAALATVAPGMNAAEAEVKADVDLPKRSETRVEIDRDRDRDVKVRTEADANISRDKVERVHKASGLMGMEVRNNEGEKLGEIKDLVLDVKSGKVSYAVLAVGGFLGIGEKLIALPPSSLKPSEDHGHLKLNADKSRIQAAPGFAATAWPSLEDPQFNRFWSSDATGGAASSEIRRSSNTDVDVDVDRDRNRLKGEVDVDRKNKIYTDADDKKVDIEVKKD
jgi:sporulation protein YlmC with PRC-barrel domain